MRLYFPLGFRTLNSGFHILDSDFWILNIKKCRYIVKHISRRNFFGSASALTAVMGGVESLEGAGKRSRGRVKNIIFLVADGTSPSILPLGEFFSSHVRGKSLLWRELMERPTVSNGWMDNASLDSPVPDSSSASTAWGSGSRVLNGYVNMLPDGTALTPITDIARQKGKRVGLVTTATITHATPAGFAAVVKDRGEEQLIAEQYMDRVDILLGGGSKFFEAKTRSDSRDLVDAYRRIGYAFAATAEEMKGIRSSKILGLFCPGYFPYVIDQRNPTYRKPGVPTLAEMTRTALQSLAGSSDGFLLQVEGGRVDHTAHLSDAAGMLWELLSFDEAIEEVLRFAEKHPDTLVIITSDHGTADPGLSGVGTEYRDTWKSFRQLARVQTSFYTLTPQLGGSAEYSMKKTEESKSDKVPEMDRIRELTHTHLGIEISDEEGEAIRKCAGGAKGLSVNRQLIAISNILGQVMTNHTGVGFIGSSHTSDYTLLTALGPGSERFRGFMQNTRIFAHMTELMGVKFKNPSIEPEEAERYRKVAGMKIRRDPDWA